MQSILIGGLPLMDADPSLAAQHVCDMAIAGISADVHLVNAFSVSIASQDQTYRSVLTGANVNFADGKPLTWAARLLHGRRLRQVRGPRLFEDTLIASQGQEIRHFLLGATPDTLQSLMIAIATLAPGAQIAGSMSPPFRDFTTPDRKAIELAIENSGANLVWVGLGTPKQDFESERIAEACGVVAVAVGAAFDFTAGSKRTAPHWMSAIGAEWLFRLMTEPRRLWRRYLFGNASFVRSVWRHRDQ